MEASQLNDLDDFFNIIDIDAAGTSSSVSPPHFPDPQSTSRQQLFSVSSSSASSSSSAQPFVKSQQLQQTQLLQHRQYVDPLFSATSSIFDTTPNLPHNARTDGNPSVFGRQPVSSNAASEFAFQMSSNVDRIVPSAPRPSSASTILSSASKRLSLSDVEEVLSPSSSQQMDASRVNGDAVAVVKMSKLEHYFSYISTAGGALLELFEKGDLIGFKNLKSKFQ